MNSTIGGDAGDPVGQRPAGGVELVGRDRRRARRPRGRRGAVRRPGAGALTAGAAWVAVELALNVAPQLGQVVASSAASALTLWAGLRHDGPPSFGRAGVRVPPHASVLLRSDSPSLRGCDPSDEGSFLLTAGHRFGYAALCLPGHLRSGDRRVTPCDSGAVATGAAFGASRVIRATVSPPTATHAAVVGARQRGQGDGHVGRRGGAEGEPAVEALGHRPGADGREADPLGPHHGALPGRRAGDAVDVVDGQRPSRRRPSVCPPSALRSSSPLAGTTSLTVVVGRSRGDAVRRREAGGTLEHAEPRRAPSPASRSARRRC